MIQKCSLVVTGKKRSLQIGGRDERRDFQNVVRLLTSVLIFHKKDVH